MEKPDVDDLINNATPPDNGFFVADDQTEPDYVPGPAANEPAAQVNDSISGETIRWTASEFVQRAKSPGWYVLLLLVVAIIAAGVWLMTKDVFSTVIVCIAGVAFAAYAGRSPRQLNYQLGPQGLEVGPRHYSYDLFRSFAVAQDGALGSIVLMPLKRFGVPVTLYYEPKDEAKIIGLLSERLPNQPHQPDAVDKLLKKIRF